MRRLGAAFQLWRDQRGVAAVEFALILPVLLLLYFGSIETASLYSADRRVANVAGTMGDLISRAKDTITESQITDYFQAASGIMQPYATGTLTQVVSLLNVDEDGVVTVEWSRQFNGGLVRASGSSYPLPADRQINLVARGGQLVAAEVHYSYRPLFGIVYPNALTLSHEEFFLPRFPGGIAIE